tara:strand:- start:26 stop:475 length:450 start_codon:yes stop_codon:yes gene_type:complete
MDKIINILLLIIIFVFDPLAISLVIASNFAFEKAYPKKKYKENLYGETVEEVATLEEQAKHTNWEYTDEDEKRMDIIGQNGNEGEHYSELDLNKDGVLDKIEIQTVEDRIEKLKNRLSEQLSQFRKRKIQEEIDFLKSNLQSNDETKTY